MTSVCCCKTEELKCGKSQLGHGHWEWVWRRKEGEEAQHLTEYFPPKCFDILKTLPVPPIHLAHRHHLLLPPNPFFVLSFPSRKIQHGGCHSVTFVAPFLIYPLTVFRFYWDGGSKQQISQVKTFYIKRSFAKRWTGRSRFYIFILSIWNRC